MGYFLKTRLATLAVHTRLKVKTAIALMFPIRERHVPHLLNKGVSPETTMSTSCITDVSTITTIWPVARGNQPASSPGLPTGQREGERERGVEDAPACPGLPCPGPCRGPWESRAVCVCVCVCEGELHTSIGTV